MGYVNIPQTAAGTWRDAVSTATALPTNSNNSGDVRVTLDTGNLYEWTGSIWQSAGGGSGGVSSLNSLTGALSIAAGGNVAVSASGSTITVSSNDPTLNFNLFEDFSTGFYSGSSAQIYADNTWATAQTGSPGFATNGSVVTSSNAHPGVLQMTVTSNGDGGALTTGLYANYFAPAFQTGNGVLSVEYLVYINALSNGTNNGLLEMGFSDTTAWNAGGNRMTLLYEYELSNNWVLNTFKTGTATQTTSSTAVTTGWHHVKVMCDATGANVYGYVDGVLVATNTTNIPTALVPPMCSYRKTLGSSAMNIGIDYISIKQAFTTAR